MQKNQSRMIDDHTLLMANDMAKSTPLAPKGDKLRADEPPVPGTPGDEILHTIINVPENRMILGQSPNCVSKLPPPTVPAILNAPAASEGLNHGKWREIQDKFNLPSLLAAVSQIRTLTRTWSGSWCNMAEMGFIVSFVSTEAAAVYLSMKIDRLKREDAQENAPIIKKYDSWIESLMFFKFFLGLGTLVFAG